MAAIVTFKHCFVLLFVNVVLLKPNRAQQYHFPPQPRREEQREAGRSAAAWGERPQSWARRCALRTSPHPNPALPHFVDLHPLLPCFLIPIPFFQVSSFAFGRGEV